MTNKIDKEIGKQKFKAKRQYIVEVEYEGEAYTKDQFEELIPTELSVEYSEYGNQGNDIELTYDKWFPQSTEKDFSGRIIQLDITEKLGEYIAETDIDYDKPWLDVSGNTPKYVRMTMRFGLSNAEQFAKVGPALEQLVDDLAPFQNLSSSNLVERSNIETAFISDEYPVTWAIPTGDPVIRFVAADSMQNEMQSTLLLGIVFCTITLWWGFRDEETMEERFNRIKKNKKSYSIKTIAAMSFMGGIMYILVSAKVALVFALLTLILSILWGISGFGIAIVTTTPIFLVIIWLYGMIEVAGYGLNMVTVAIAAMSLGVGIDYVIHVVERFREEQENGHDNLKAIEIVGGASGLALFGSALSDIGGFLVITQSSMGFFSTFGLFCAIMIGLSLIASMILTPALIGVVYRKKNISLN